MNKVNKFYSLKKKDSLNHSVYDINDLGEKISRGFDIAFVDIYGNMEGGDLIMTKTTPDDYDQEFYKKLISINPVYNVSELLDYHLNNFKNIEYQEDLFLRHIQYIILPKLIRYYKKQYYDITNEWLIKKNKTMLRRHLEEKNHYLKKVYEESVAYSPSEPLSVTIDPLELGESLGFDVSTTERIVNELVQDGYLESTLGMGIIMITKYGLNYLREIEILNDINPISINVGDNSNFQFQQGNVNSSQNIKINEFEKNEYIKLIREIKDNIDVIERYLDIDSREDLNLEIEYLDRTLKKQNPKKDIINTITSGIFDILKSVPANIIANIITSQIPM